MPFTLKQWTTRALAIALVGEDESAYQSAEDSAEALAHHVMYEVAEELASDPATAPLVEETVTVALTNGVGALPAKVLTRHLRRATVFDSADATLSRKVRYLPWRKFVRPLTSRYGSFSVKAGTAFYLVRPGSTYTPGSGMTGNVEITTACAPDMPATESATISVPLKVEEMLVERLAARLKIPAPVPQRRAA